MGWMMHGVCARNRQPPATPTGRTVAVDIIDEKGAGSASDGRGESSGAGFGGQGITLAVSDL